MKKDRRAELRFYEWDVTRWLTSRARMEMQPLGRYIYRELLDLAHAQGKIPRSHDAMARYCDISTADFEDHWPKMQRYFHVDKHDPDSLVNDFASVVRKNFFAFLKRQKKNAKKPGSIKPNGTNELRSGGRGLAPIQEEEEDKKKKKIIQEPSPTPPSGGVASPAGEAEAFALSPPEPSNGTAPSVRTLRNVQALTGELLDGTPPDSPGDVRPAVPPAVPIRKTGPELIAEAAARIRERHPAKRRCSIGEVKARLTAILRAVPQRERAGKLERIEANHAAWCECEQWTKDGGEYAKGLDNWLAPTKGRFDEEPAPEVAKSRDDLRAEEWSSR